MTSFAGMAARLRTSGTGTPPIAGLGWRHIAGIAAAGLAADMAIQHGPATVASALAVFVVAATLLGSGRVTAWSSRILLVAAMAFGVMLALRVSPWLVPLNFVAAWGLMGTSAAMSQRGRVFDAPITSWATQGIRVGIDGLSVVPVLRGVLAGGGREGRAATISAIALGVTLAAPLILLLGGLLMSGDAVFAELLGGLEPGRAVGHILGVASGMIATLVLLQGASGVVADPSFVSARIRPATTGVVLGALILLYGAFATTTAVVAIAGADAFLDDPAAVADWAREGFFQLLAVAAITLAVLMILRAVTQREHPASARWFRIGSTLAVLLTEVIVFAAVARIWAYSDAYGLTILRLYSAFFAVLVGLVFAFFLARVWDIGGRAEWLPFASGVAALAILFGLNVANPEAVVVRVNLAQRHDVERFDVAYLARLSDNAAPALQDRIDELSAPEQALVRTELCGRVNDGGWLAWNFGSSRGADAREEICQE